MSETRGSQAPPRPRQVTIAATLIMAGSIFIVVSVFDQISGIRSIETRESVETFLATPPGDGLGLDVDDVLLLLRTLAMVAGGCATAAAILGGYVLQRSRSARIGLSVLALPLFVSGVAVGGFMSSVVVASAVMLWLQPARDWYDGITPAPAPTPPTPPAPVRPTPPAFQQPPVRAVGEAGPPAYPGFGAAPGTPSVPGADFDPGSWPAPDARQRVAGDPGRRPPAVAWACAITWAVCGLTIVAMLLTVLVLAMSPDSIFEEARRQNPDLATAGATDQALANATYVTAAVAVLWSAAAITFAVFAWRRASWGWIALLASAALAAVLFLVTTLVSVVLVVGFAAAAASVYLLLRPDVRGWFTAPR